MSAYANLLKRCPELHRALFANKRGVFFGHTNVYMKMSQYRSLIGAQMVKIDLQLRYNKSKNDVVS